MFLEFFIFVSRPDTLSKFNPPTTLSFYVYSSYEHFIPFSIVPSPLPEL